MARVALLALAIALLGVMLPRGSAARDQPPEGRHRLAVAHAHGERPASSVVDCDELAAWLPETAGRVQRANEIVGEIGRLGAELEPPDFVAALKGFAAEFAAMADAQWGSEPPAGVLDANQELATTFDNYATVVREIADMLEYAQIALAEGASIDWGLLDEAWSLLPRLNDHLGLIVDDLDEVAVDCGVED
jgi:hypothetical protein